MEIKATMPSRFGLTMESICTRNLPTGAKPFERGATCFDKRQAGPAAWRSSKRNVLKAGGIRASASLVVLIAAGILSGCGGGSNSAITVTSVAITPSAATVNLGAQTDFTA